jgi:nicotinamidase-related amidase
MSRQHEALMIVDLQKAFEVPPKLLDGIRRYARRFPCRIFTQFVNPPGSIFRRKLGQRCCAPGSEDTELLIAPEPGDLVFTKWRYGLSPANLRQMRRRGIKQVTVCGVDTDACVLGVMFSLFDAQIGCRVKAKYCWSSTGLHHAGLAIIQEQFEPLK